MAEITPARLAYRILTGFEKSYRLFCRITGEAQHRFEQADWAGVHQASTKRIKLYDQMIAELAFTLYCQLDAPRLSTHLWQTCKHHYSYLLNDHPQPELAESFFNSVFAQLFHRQGLVNRHLYIYPRQLPRHDYQRQSLCNSQPLGCLVTSALGSLLRHYTFHLPWEDLERDLTLVRKALKPILQQEEYRHLELMKPVFYRNKGAYLIGRLRTEHPGHRDRPLVLAILNNERKGLYIDAVLTNRDDLSILFGFARAYFMVHHPCPSQLVAYLKELMPHKTRGEIYGALGIQKHAKTEFYRQLLHHLNNSNDSFVTAPGIEGLVMLVFSLPTLDVVFKVIRDRFKPPKECNPRQIRDKYQMVKDHDRVGRLADTQEFFNLCLPRDRFSPALLRQLQQQVSSSMEVTETRVCFKHLYIERRMLPLNIFLNQANQQQLDNAIDEYGNAIKQLIAANIFPGDLLFKNFGITRHGRVIFYDYDEICYLHQCHFRAIPAPTTPEQEMAAEPWYSIGEFDVFPEEFSHFLLGRPEIRQAFMQHHPELLTPRYWQTIQQRVQAGHIADVFPYRRQRRLSRVKGSLK